MLNFNLNWLIFFTSVFVSINKYIYIYIVNTLFGWPFDDRTIITPDVAYGCETWASRLTDEERLKVFENGVMRNIFWSNTEEVTGGWKNLPNGVLRDPYSGQKLFVFIKWRRIRGGKRVANMRRREICKAFWFENLNEVGHLEDLGADGKIILKLIFHK